jgi:hypothetical protein
MPVLPLAVPVVHPSHLLPSRKLLQYSLYARDAVPGYADWECLPLVARGRLFKLTSLGMR